MKELTVQLKDEQAKALESGELKLALLKSDQLENVEGGAVTKFTVSLLGSAQEGDQ